MIRLSGTARYIRRMAIFLIAVLALSVALNSVLREAFMHNPSLNGTILLILAIGCGFVFRQVQTLNPEIDWLEQYGSGRTVLPTTPVRLLSPMASMLGERTGRLSLSPASTRSLLDSIGARLDEGRDIARYLIGLLILLGLLGTFWGLIQTVESVGDVVGRLTMGGGDPVAAFEDLKRGLATPLAAMGTAFSSSLFGLAGSLILGFLDLQAGQAQNRFYNELEEWLSGQTRLTGGGPVSEGEASVPAYIQALLETTADNLESLQRTIARGEESRISANSSLLALAEKLGTLSDQMRAEQALMVRLAETQLEMRPVLTRLADRMGEASGDDQSRIHLRNIEIYVARMVDEAGRNRDEMVQELRSEIRLLARTIAAAAEETDPR